MKDVFAPHLTALPARPRHNKKPQKDAGAILMAHVLRDPDISIMTGKTIAGSNEWYTASWLNQFKPLASRHGRVKFIESAMPQDSNPWRADSYGYDTCLDTMRNASPEVREKCMEFLKDHKDKASYSNMMRSVINVGNGSVHALDNFLAFHDSFMEVIGDADPDTFTSDWAAKFSYDLSKFSEHDLAVHRAVLVITTFCATSADGGKYIKKVSQDHDQFTLASTGTSGWHLYEDILTVVRRNPESVGRIIAAMKNSAVRLTPNDFAAVLDGSLPVSLLDGML